MQQRPKRFDDLFKRFAGALRATEAAAFAIRREGTEREHLHLLAHARGGPAVDDATTEAAVIAFKIIVRPCISSGTDATVDVDDKKFCLVRFRRDETGTAAIAYAFIVRRDDREKAEATLLRLLKPARQLHNPPMQRTGAAGILSKLRKLLGRGSGR